MVVLEKLYVISADRLNGAVIISFNDGRCAFYSADLLYSILPNAQDITDLSEDEEYQPSDRPTAVDLP